MPGRLLDKLVMLVFVATCVVAAPVATAEIPPVDFRRQIWPLVSDRCFACHGPDANARQGGLRLDDREVAVAKHAIVPGAAAASELVRRINSDDPDEIMPPPSANKKSLSKEDREILARWINEGAEYRPHWSLIPPMRPPLPVVKDKAWIRTPIDQLVLARLEAEGVTSAPEADRRTLIRRLSLDLTGLPPTAEEVKAFVSDDRSDAYEQLVDRLLASPRFGERMALDWLDAARYADTNGFSIDGGRHQWLWRDWVIDAFNRNVPYDQFLIEQLAGDLLPNPADAQRIATGFQRNNMVTHEGGTIPEENLTNYNVDRVKTLGESVLGLTLGCAQCHDHKYDPITQREYYQVYAYFNTIADQGLDGDSGINPQPILNAKTVLDTGEVPELERQIAELKNQLSHPDPQQIAAWEEEQRGELAERGDGFELLPVELLKVSTPNQGAGFGIEDARFVRITQPTGVVAYEVSVRLPQTKLQITGLRIVFHPDASAPGGGRGHGKTVAIGEKLDADANRGTFVLTALTASADVVPSDQVNLNRLLNVRRVTADSWLPAFEPSGVLDTGRERAWSPDPAGNGAARITQTFDVPVDLERTPYVTVQLNFGFGSNLVAARFEILALSGTDDDSTLPNDVIAIINTPTMDRTAVQNSRLVGYYAEHASATFRERVRLANLEERLTTLTRAFPTMVMSEAEHPRETRILHRGDYAQPTDKVSPATPAALPPLPAGAPTNRLGLAQWITMPEHPLTSRVEVNRLWRLLFGAGIVRTPADFGTQGEYPTHPELLDWLAVDFREHGWDVKRMVRQIVTSATYRQSSMASAERLANDPDNRLLARGPRFRLSAELVRDATLHASGLLVSWIGGPSVNPYMPGDLWREISHYGSSPATSQAFIQDHGEKLYRRSLYTYWKRTSPPPNMAAFDAPTRETCIIARPTTTTPLQALVLLNDVQFVEAARAFAERIVHQASDDAPRINWAFEECLSRPPTSQETAVLERALARERQRYGADEAAARAYLASGESPRDERIAPAEHAAWAQVAAILLNLSETVTRN